jgi:hypothetical protein
MSVQTRTTALQNEIVRLYCTFERDGRLADPSTQPAVNIIDTDGVTLLSSVKAVKETTGIWYADYFIPAELPLGQYYDEWTFQWSGQATVREKTFLFSVHSLDTYVNFVSPAIDHDISPNVVQLMKDLKNDFIYEAQHIPVYWEQGMRVQEECQDKRVKKYYYFTLPAGEYEIYAGDVYVNNGQKFTVWQDVISENSSSSTCSDSDSYSTSSNTESSDSTNSGSTSDVYCPPEYPDVLVAVGSGAPDASGTLTLFEGEGQATISFVSVEEKISNFSTIYNFAYKNWNQDPRPILRLNNRIVDDGWFADYNGNIYIDGIIYPEDSVNLTYQFACFSDEELLAFLRLGLMQMNATPPASDFYSSLAQAPQSWWPGILLYAAVTALKRLVFGLNFREKAVIFARPDDPDFAQTVIGNLKDLYQDYNNTWNEVRVDIKKKLQPTGIYVTPEYTLPGGRSRWFRYLYKGGS